MDVLQVLKEGHEKVRSLYAQTESSLQSKDLKAVFDELFSSVKEQIYLEKGYLYPEIEGLFSEAEAFVNAGLHRQKALEKSFSSLSESLCSPVSEENAGSVSKKVAELSGKLMTHLDQTDQVLFPKIRQLISTPDREDLGQQFMELRAELRKRVAASEDLSPPQKQKKRA